MVDVLKLGGSVLTDKTEPETVDDERLAAAAAAIADADRDLVLVHGGGSFGHHHADRHGVTDETGTTDAAAVTDIHGAMTELNGAVVEALQAAGVPAVPIRPLSAASRGAGGELRLATDPLGTLRAEGFTPVLHGDVVGHAGAGATILSGDDLVVALAEAIAPDRVGLCTAVGGVLEGDGDVVDRIERFADVAEALGGAEGTDVTGGMAGKVRALLALETSAAVFGPGDLPAFLAGESPGTEIAGGR